MTATDQIVAAMTQLTAARTAQMLDMCTVVRPAPHNPTPVLDPNGDPTAPLGTPVYSGRCTISDPTRPDSGNSKSVGEDSGVPNTRILKVPHTAALRPGDILTVDSTEFSPGMVNDEYTVLGEEERSYATCRRYRLRGSSWLPTGSGQ